MSKNKHPAIHVASTRENFRRAGHVFGTKPTTIALAALHPDQHAAIIADRSLVVVDTAVHLSEAESAALPHRGAQHVIEATAKLDTLASVDEDHAQRAVALADIEAELREREAGIKLREDGIAQREEDLKQREHELADRQDSIERAQAQLDEQRTTFQEQRIAHETSKHTGVEGVSHAEAANSKKKGQ